jgi:prevent-host-death family protein
MRIVNIHDAKTHFSRYVEAAERGEEITIARAGIPVARLVPLKPRPRGRRLGLLEGRILIADDFDAPLPAEVLERFEGA